MLQEHDETCLGVAQVLAEDYRAAFDKVCLIALPSSPAARIARIILDWSSEAKQKAPGAVVTMPLTHDELASMAATTRETVTRTLGRFRKEKLIARRGSVLSVLQPIALDRLAAC